MIEAYHLAIITLHPTYLLQPLSNYSVFSGIPWSDKNFKFRRVQQNNWHIVLVSSLAYHCHLTIYHRPIWLRPPLNLASMCTEYWEICTCGLKYPFAARTALSKTQCLRPKLINGFCSARPMQLRKTIERCSDPNCSRTPLSVISGNARWRAR
jgi:hypothetical protein